jgi:hypothetical protein
VNNDIVEHINAVDLEAASILIRTSLIPHLSAHYLSLVDAIVCLSSPKSGPPA